MTTFTYTTPALIKNELRATQDFSPTTMPTLATVNTWIEEESAFINHLAGKVFGIAEYTEILDYRGEDKLYLLNAPVVDITSVLYSEYPLGSDEYSLTTAKTEDVHYTTYSSEGYLALLPKWSPSVGRKRIEVVYLSGNPEVPLIVQKLATKLVTKRVMDTIIESDLNEQKSGKTVAVGTVRITKSSSFGVAQYQVLNKEIVDLSGQIVGGTSAFRVPIHRI